MKNLITEWELALTVWLQKTCGIETWPLWNFITELGSAEALLVIIGSALWLKGTSTGLRLLAAVLLAGVIVGILKVLIGAPRPYYAFVEIQTWRDSTGFGMPSGHAAAAMTLWGLLVAIFKRWWFTLIAVLLIVLIGVSRVYFGVHSPLQVFAGWSLGLAIVISVALCGGRLYRRLEELSLWSQLTLATSSTLVLVVLQLTVFQPLGDSSSVPELWQQRYEAASAFEAKRLGEPEELQTLALYTAFDISQTGVILGTWLLSIVVLQQGGFAAFDRRRRAANCMLGMLASALLILLLHVSKHWPWLGFIIWVLIPLTLGLLVPSMAARFTRRE